MAPAVSGLFNLHLSALFDKITQHFAVLPFYKHCDLFGNMKQYVIDDLRPPEMERLQAWCAANLEPTCFDNVFWLTLDEVVLTETQQQHAQCRPHYLALTLEPDRAVVDMVVRTQRTLHCECMGYINVQQFAWLDSFVDAVFGKLGIKA